MSTVAIEQRTAKPRPAPAAALLEWYDRERRDLPWRYGPGETPDPYKVWLSEVMLQQTTVKAVIPYFLAFLERWPTIGSLAQAPLDDVLAAWAGLGYYSRARNLHACAVKIAREHGSRFPESEEGLRTLPGIGQYTAAAIAAIAFGAGTSPVDGNIERVVARYFAVEEPLPQVKPRLRALSTTWTPAARAGDFAQALMDLGARICTPKRPSCLMCPLERRCAARAAGIAASLPRRGPKAARPVRHGLAFVALREDGQILVRRRPDAGLLGGMLEIPSSTWSETAIASDVALQAAPLRAEWWPVPGLVTHTFTHFKLQLAVVRAFVPVDRELDLWAEPERCRWLPRRSLGPAALPSVMRKVIAHALKDA